MVKTVTLVLCLSVFISCMHCSRVVIHTSNQTGTLYQFFPLRTNHLQFAVKATNDVHVSLTNSPSLMPPYYEIAIGGWENTKSVIRKDNGIHQVEHFGKILNEQRFQMIWVTIDENEGSISVGKNPKEHFLVFKDKDFVRSSYFGISTGFGSKGEWNFDFDMFNCDNHHRHFVDLNHLNNTPIIEIV